MVKKMIKECINCGKKLTDKGLQTARESGTQILYCGRGCKETYYKDNFAGQIQALIWEEEYRTHKNLEQKEILKEFEIWEKTHPKGFYLDWLKSLGDFEDPQRKETLKEFEEWKKTHPNKGFCDFILSKGGF